MNKITIEVQGMRCPMCESHTNDAIRKAFPKVKSVTSSHKEARTVLLIEEEIGDDAIRAALADTGYVIGNITREVEKKKKLFGLFG